MKRGDSANIKPLETELQRPDPTKRERKRQCQRPNLPDYRHEPAPYTVGFGDARCVLAHCSCERLSCACDRWVVLRFAPLDHQPHPRAAALTLRQWLDARG